MEEGEILLFSVSSSSFTRAKNGGKPSFPHFSLFEIVEKRKQKRFPTKFLRNQAVGGYVGTHRQTHHFDRFSPYS